jgi:asparagine synthase (glutamine-hydrolysing)
MHYFSGIYNFGRKNIFDFKIENMKIKNGNAEYKVFSEDNFKLCWQYPKQYDPILSVPLFSQSRDGNVAVILEGRIENKSELLAKISDKKLRSGCSDVDLISALYSEYGLESFSFLKGSYAFVIWDREKKELILHKDKVGMKPLYYCKKDNVLIFGTFLGAIFESNLIKKEINFKWLSNYFFMDGLNQGDDTEYEGLKNLMPGKILIANKSGISLSQIEVEEKFKIDQLSEKEIRDRFREIMFDSIKKTFSLGQSASLAFSGGIDTKIILAASKKYKFPIDTFTLEFESRAECKNIDYQLAKKTAKKYKVKHHRINSSTKKFLKEIETILKPSERLINFNSLNSLYIFKLLSKSNSLIISGDGSEEQLSLYGHHLFPNRADYLLENIPLYHIKILSKPIIETYCNSFFCRSWEWRDDSPENNETIFKKNLFSETAIKKVGKCNSTKTFYSCLADSPDTEVYYYKKSPFSSFLNKALWIDFKNNFSPRFFAVCDFISRFNSVEIISPFLDADFVDFSSKIPASMKFKPEARQGKYIMRQAAEKLIGKKNAYTNFKSGSDIPFYEWLVDPCFEIYVRNMLKKSKIKKYGILNPEYVEKIINEHYREKELIDSFNKGGNLIKKGIDHTHKILKLLGFQFWLDNNFKA